jgi:histidinol phosphatase-like PHP family hydrolase
MILDRVKKYLNLAIGSKAESKVQKDFTYDTYINVLAYPDLGFVEWAKNHTRICDEVLWADGQAKEDTYQEDITQTVSDALDHCNFPVSSLVICINGPPYEMYKAELNKLIVSHNKFFDGWKDDNNKKV